jgi:hypothetical protein
MKYLALVIMAAITPVGAANHSHGAGPTLSVSFVPPAPSIPPNSPGGTIIAQIVPRWSNGRPFTGVVAFGPPNFSDGGCFAIDGSFNVITACDLTRDGGTVQNITAVATQ